jgi:hypothetical protein
MMNNVLFELIGETLKKHNSKLRAVFQKFNLRIEPDKCEFLKEKLSYLGHIVTAEGVRPDDNKIDFPTPKTQVINVNS